MAFAAGTPAPIACWTQRRTSMIGSGSQLAGSSGVPAFCSPRRQSRSLAMAVRTTRAGAGAHPGSVSAGAQISYSLPMQLFVIRHAIAEERGPDQDDAARKLTDEGAAKMKQVVRGLRELDLELVRVLT